MDRNSFFDKIDEIEQADYEARERAAFQTNLDDSRKNRADKMKCERCGNRTKISKIRAMSNPRQKNIYTVCTVCNETGFFTEEF